MATNLAVDMKRLERAYKIGGFRTKRETVDQALAEFINRRQQHKITQLFGTIEFEKGWDYKKGRSGREFGG